MRLLYTHISYPAFEKDVPGLSCLQSFPGRAFVLDVGAGQGIYGNCWATFQDASG